MDAPIDCLWCHYWARTFRPPWLSRFCCCFLHFSLFAILQQQQQQKMFQFVSVYNYKLHVDLCYLFWTEDDKGVKWWQSTGPKVKLVKGFLILTMSHSVIHSPNWSFCCVTVSGVKSRKHACWPDYLFWKVLWRQVWIQVWRISESD